MPRHHPWACKAFLPGADRDRRGPAARGGFPIRAMAFVLALAASSGAVWAWEGRLIGPDGAPLVGARVTPVGGSAGVLTDGEGRFRLPGEAPSASALLVERADGSLAVVEIPPGHRGPVEIRVPSFGGLTIRVTATAAGQLLAPPGSPTRSFDRDDPALQRARSLQQAVSALPGAARAHEDPDRVPVLRGMGQGRTLLLLDGAPLGSERRAGVSGGIFDSGTWGGLDVVRGPTGVAYGSAAMAGALLIKSPWAEPAGSPAVEFDLSAAAGGNPGAAASLRWRAQGWAVAAAWRAAPDPEAPGGTPLEGEFRRRSFFAGKSLLVAGGLLRVGIRADRLADADRLQAPDPARLTRLPSEGQERVVARFERGGSRPASLLFWGARGRRTIEQRRDLTVRAETSEQDYGFRFTRSGSSAGGWWLVGAETRWRRGIRTRITVAGRPDLDGVPLDDGEQRSAAFFAQGTRLLPRSWFLAAGLRIEPIRSRAVSLDRVLGRTTTATAGVIALGHPLAGGEASVQIARGFREPLLSERYYRGITGRGIVEPNPDLERELSRQIDLVWRRSGPRHHVEVAAFEARIRDVIVRRLVASGELDRYRFENAGRGLVRGLELDAALRLGPRAGALRLTAHRILGRDGERAALDDIPAAGGTLAWERESRRAGWRAELVVRGRKSDPGPGEQVTPGWARIDVGAFLRLRRGLSLSAGITNLLDRTIPSSPRRHAPAAPGRTVTVGLRWSGPAAPAGPRATGTRPPYPRPRGHAGMPLDGEG